MSLVNLAHVCSHLQNASLARLGLTSIPYTKWHLSLALLLQKQGFLSQVKLGGLSPPASCFGQGPRDDHTVTNHPHGSAGRNRFSSEAALAKMVRQHWTPSQSQQYGFGQEAIDFAQEHGRKTLEQLNAQGWQQHTARFLFDFRSQVESIAEEWDREYARRRNLCETPEQISALDEELGVSAEARFERVQEDIVAQLQPEKAQTYTKYASVPLDELHTVEFDEADISSIAGDKVYLTEREIRQNGITIEAMGLRIPNQQVTLPVDEFQDPDMMEAEGVVTQANRASRRLWLGLKYYQSSPVLSKAKMISKPTKRIWLSRRDLAKVVRGGQAGEVKPLTQIGEIVAVSTDRGIMEARECVERKIGGQPLCRVW